jgi:dynein heavy chain
MSVENSPATNVLEERLKILNDYFTLNLYQNVCRSLFEVHKLLFSLILTHKILDGYKQMDPIEWRYLLAGT